jgi:hypothetical protein
MIKILAGMVCGAALTVVGIWGWLVWAFRKGPM